MSYFKDLQGKKVIVTGGSKGIGEDIAMSFAELGADVVITGRNKDLLVAVTEKLTKHNVNCSYFTADIQNVSEVTKMIKYAIDYLGGLDILVNNAGINIPKPAIEVTEEDWDRIMDTNLKGVFFTSQQAGRFMLSQQKGKIINIASQMAFVGYAKRAAYCSSKGGVVQLTKALAIEWAPYNIKVNAVAPTFIETELTSKMFTDEVFYKDVLHRIPLGRLAQPSDVTGAVLYLASDMANFVNGETIRVDGGWTAI